MINIFFIVLIVILISYFIFKSQYKKFESITEELFYIAFCFLIVIVYIIYLIDKNNIPTLFSWIKNINSENWLNYIMTIISAVFAEIIGGIILIYVTRLQIDESNNFNRKRDKEERRINNLPLLSYTFSCDKRIENKNNEFCIESKFNNKNNIILTLCLKNIGVSSIRKTFIKIEGDSLKDYGYSKLDIQNSLDKGEEKSVSYLINLSKGDYEFKIVVYYEDILCNWYSQEIILNCDVTNYHIDNNVKVNLTYSILDEKIDIEPTIEENLTNI